MEYEVEGTRPRGRPKRTWREVVKKECQARKLNKEDAMDHSRWRKLIKDVWWSGWVWVGECFFLYWPTRVVPDKGPLNGCVCVLFLNVICFFLELNCNWTLVVLTCYGSVDVLCCNLLDLIWILWTMQKGNDQWMERRTIWDCSCPVFTYVSHEYMQLLVS